MLLIGVFANPGASRPGSRFARACPQSFPENNVVKVEFLGGIGQPVRNEFGVDRVLMKAKVVRLYIRTKITKSGKLGHPNNDDNQFVFFDP